MATNGMLNEERRRSILELIHRDGRVLVKDLAETFDTSQITIRKDLEVLDTQGFIQRTHGGALTVQSGTLLDPSLREKERYKVTEVAGPAAQSNGCREWEVSGTLNALGPPAKPHLPLDQPRIQSA